MTYDIQTIPHKDQRYDTVGDYWESEASTGTIVHFRISQLSDPRFEWLVLIHELTEYFIVKLEGIPLASIDEFDKKFEEDRPEGNTDEPGDSIAAPYFMAHQTATMVERMFAIILGVFWKVYEAEINSLIYN